MTKTRILLASIAAACCGLAAAQSQPVLQGDQITESALIDALAPAPVLTRSINPNAAAQPAKKAAAALLITFETGASTLTAQAKRELDVVGQALNSSKLSNSSFVIEGHADPRGNPERNMALSKGRAEAVRLYLVQAQKVPADRLSAVGKGDTEPLDAGNPSAPENRRVTFVNVAR